MERTKFKSIKDTAPVSPEVLKDLNHPDFHRTLDEMNYTDISASFEKIVLKYRTDMIKAIYFLAKHGCNEKEMAEFFGVTRDTISQWKLKYPEFQQAMMQGRDLAVMGVTESLFKRAMGYTFEETEVGQHINRKGEIINVEKRTTKHIPPDVGAICFYLKNRQPELWQDVNKTEISSNVSVNHELNMDNLTDEEKALLRSISLKKIASQHGIAR